MKFFAPEFKAKAFNCPYCDAYSQMKWVQLSSLGYSTKYWEAFCTHCEKESIWLQSWESLSQGKMIYPDVGFAYPPETDMPEDVKKDYLEAASIFSKSPRGGAALLRLALQKLCKHLGEDGRNINDDIRSLARKGKLAYDVIKVADTVRITGNNAVHPGEMSEEDFDNVSAKLFDLLNFIVRKAITEPKELEELYQKTPEGPRNAAKDKDLKKQGA